MIKKLFRGISRLETDKIFRSGNKKRFKNGTLYWETKKEKEGARVVVSVAKKAVKRAVTRTLFRRRLQAAIGPLLKECKPADIMIVWATGEAPNVTVQRDEIRSILTQEGLLE